VISKLSYSLFAACKSDTAWNAGNGILAPFWRDCCLTDLAGATVSECDVDGVCDDAANRSPCLRHEFMWRFLAVLGRQYGRLKCQ